MSLSAEDLEPLHPIDMVQEFVQETGWNYSRRNESLLCFERWGKWGRYDFAVGLRESGTTIGFFAQFDLTKPNKMVRLPLRFYELLNHINRFTLLGMYAYIPENSIVSWSYGLIMPEQGEVDVVFVEALIEQALSEIDMRYPSFQLILTPNVTVQEAFDNAIPDAYGNA
jgi:hypothetical protein